MRGRSPKKWEIVRRIMEEQGRRIFHLVPPFLNKHLTSRLEERIFFLLVYIDHLTCEKKIVVGPWV